MIQQIDNELLEIKIKLKEKENYQHKLEAIMTELKEYNFKKNNLMEQLKKEKKDVDKLEKLSFTSIWYSLVGGKQARLQKEKNELSQVEYEYKFVCETIERLKGESEYYKDKIYGIRRLEDEYQKLLIEKEQLIMDSNNDLYQPLNDINQRIVENENNLKEITEAINAGKQVLNALETINNALRKAKGWGTYDVLGGGFFASMIKHSHLDDAENKMRDLKYLLNKYTRELKDVNMSVSINLDISDMLKFADFFFDNIFSDAMVQSKINRSLEQVRNAYNKITYQIKELNNQYQNNQNEIERLKEKKKSLLIPK